MVKFGRKLAFNILLTGGLIAGFAFIADRLNLGTRISEAAFATGKAGGAVISEPIAGIAGGLTEGLQSIRNQAQKLAEQIGGAGADVQEQVTGDRNALSNFAACIEAGGDFGCCLTGSCEKSTKPFGKIELPEREAPSLGVTFPKQSIEERVASILQKQNIAPTEDEITKRVQAILQGQKARTEIEKAQRGEDSDFVIIGGVPYSTEFISEEELRRQLGA